VVDYVQGPVLIDVFDGDHRELGGDRPSLVGKVTVDAPGPFELQIAEGTNVWLSAYNDMDGDGRPSREEPNGEYERNPVRGKSDVDGVTLVLSTEHNRGKK
jgi:hypothetical protein